jgi:hypothetical protein
MSFVWYRLLIDDVQPDKKHAMREQGTPLCFHLFAHSGGRQSVHWNMERK